MTQRVFDIENEKDMQDLWDILPEHINKIKGDSNRTFTLYLYNNNNCCYNLAYNIFKINWHDKTEIYRPGKEATAADVGKLCKFWDKKEDRESIGILSGFEYDGAFVDDHSWCWSHCRRLTKQEIEELC